MDPIQHCDTCGSEISILPSSKFIEIDDNYLCVHRRCVGAYFKKNVSHEIIWNVMAGVNDFDELKTLVSNQFASENGNGDWCKAQYIKQCLGSFMAKNGQLNLEYWETQVKWTFVRCPPVCPHRHLSRDSKVQLSAHFTLSEFMEWVVFGHDMNSLLQYLGDDVCKHYASPFVAQDEIYRSLRRLILHWNQCGLRDPEKAYSDSDDDDEI